MQFYRKTRRGSNGTLIKPLIKILIFIIVLVTIFFLISNLDLPAPNKIIKQKIPNEKFKVIK
tara:strand:- start:323 stop:508 length:186 start_codon:yes stop_codon:yes gene_type:complete